MKTHFLIVNIKTAKVISMIDMIFWQNFTDKKIEFHRQRNRISQTKKLTYNFVKQDEHLHFNLIYQEYILLYNKKFCYFICYLLLCFAQLVQSSCSVVQIYNIALL